MGTMRGKSVGLFCVWTLLAAGIPVQAGPVYHFVDITNPGSANAIIGESQLSMEVLPVDVSQVEFRIFNTGPAPSSVCDVYFDGNVLLSVTDILNEPGVLFSSPATPPDLPGGNNVTPPFVTTAQLSADSDPSVEHNGIEPGEELGIVLTFQPGSTYDTVLDALASADLRVGLHVQGFADGGSESFINTPHCPDDMPGVPAPGAGLLALFGAGMIGIARRRLAGTPL